MTEYRFATSQDWPKVIDFIDLVFSQSARPHDFAALIPKVYGDGHDYSHIHAIALEDGEIRGCVAVLPVDMTVAGQQLRMGYLGSVSVHRLSRGAGHMKKLMQMQLEKAQAGGLDMIVLGGQRQRYGYFGFSPAGGAYEYSITHANVRHALKDVDASAFTFEPLAQGESSEYAYALYQQQPVCGSRTAENFAERALTFESKGWLILENGKKSGYLIASNDGKGIREIVMENPALVPAVLKAWLALQQVRGLYVDAAPYHTTLNRTLAAFAEYYSMGQDGLVLCLNYSNVIRSWMTLKNSITPLSEGTVRLGIDGETIEIKVADGIVHAEKTTAPADVSLTAEEAHYLLFSANRFYAPVTPGIPADWFPLPLFIPRPETF